MIYVVATVTVHPNRREAFLAEVRKVCPEVSAEHGCLEYSPAIDVQTGHPRQVALRPNVVTIVERWVDAEALKAHAAAPHMLAFRTRCADMVAATDLQVLEPA
jgi:quinol monooxygenase YgiN